MRRLKLNSNLNRYKQYDTAPPAEQRLQVGTSVQRGSWLRYVLEENVPLYAALLAHERSVPEHP